MVKRTARAILLDTRESPDHLIVIKRTKPGRAPYWITPGGGVEPEDATVLDALHREVFEELGAEITDVVPAFVDTVPYTPGDGEEARPGLKVQHFFACRLASMDPALRHGPEVEHPCGTYEIVRLPFTPQALASVDVVPSSLRTYLSRNIVGIRALFAPDFA